MKTKGLDRMAFRREYILLEDGRPFGAVMDPWQAEDYLALDSGDHPHGYLERPRGHSKTGDIGTEAVVELVLGRPGQQLFCAAADEDQARLLFDDVAGKLRRHPALRALVKVGQREIAVKATGSRLRVLASDAPSAYGLRPDWIAVDELAEWRRRDLWDSLWSATGKRPGCRMLVISTAGWDRTSIAWEVREHAERERDWYFRSRGQCASWIKPEWVEQQRRTLPGHVFERLHMARWVEAVGAWLTGGEVDGVFGPVPEGDGARAGGLDIGLTLAKTVAAVVRRDAATGIVVVEALVTWDPKLGGKTELPDVEEAVGTLAQRFRCPFRVDPWQGVLLGQRLRQRGVQVIEYPFTGDNRRALFIGLLDLVRANKLRARPHDELRRELLSLEATETAAGWRVDHKPGRFDDHVVAVGLAVQGLPAWAAGSAWADDGYPVGPVDDRLLQQHKAEKFAVWSNAATRRTRSWARSRGWDV